MGSIRSEFRGRLPSAEKLQHVRLFLRRNVPAENWLDANAFGVWLVSQAARLDFIHQPVSKVSAEAKVSRKDKDNRISKKLKSLDRKVKGGVDKAAKVSVEGRGMVITS